MPLSDFLDWMQGSALPTWIEAGRDRTSKLYFERLLLNAQPDRDTALRTRTQFRQLYVWSHASVMGLIDQDRGISEAIASADALRAALWSRGGKSGWARAMSLTGAIVDPVIDLYDHACVLLGLAWLYKASGDRRFLDWIDETLDVNETILRASGGGWAEDDLGTLPRRQNPHMHLLEAMLALHEITAEQRFLQAASSMMALFRDHLFDGDTGSLREYFGPEWQVTADWQSDDRLEPGHHCEWVWLLRRYARADETADVDRYCKALLERAQSIGTLQPHGFLALEVDATGKPRQSTQRLWAQGEYTKALIVQGDLTAAGDLFAQIKRHYLDPAPAGTWMDALTLDTEPVATHIPASSLYHLLTIIPELRLATGK
jgi:mannose-6-phosphate isomerase